MTKEQIRNEVNSRIKTLKSYLEQVQSIENSNYDTECQYYFSSVTSVIRKMEVSLQRIEALSDSEFAEYDTARFMRDLDKMMTAPTAGFMHIKRRPPIPKPKYHPSTSGKAKLSKKGVKLLCDEKTEDPSEPGMA